MSIVIRPFQREDVADAVCIWNQVVEDGVAFPQTELLDEVSGMEFFLEQSFTGIAVDEESGGICGSLYSSSQQYRALRSYLQRQLRGAP